MTPARQAVFDAIYAAIRTHAPDLPVDKRVAIATDAALKLMRVAPVFSRPPADCDAAAAQRWDRRLKS